MIAVSITVSLQFLVRESFMNAMENCISIIRVWTLAAFRAAIFKSEPQTSDNRDLAAADLGWIEISGRERGERAASGYRTRGKPADILAAITKRGFS